MVGGSADAQCTHRFRKLPAVTVANEQMLGTFPAYLSRLNDDRFFVEDDLAVVLADPARRKTPWSIVVTGQRVLIRMKRRRTNIEFAFDVATATFEPAANSPGMAFLELGPNTLSCRPMLPGGLVAMDVAFRMAHGEEDLLSPAGKRHVEQLAFTRAVRRARFRGQVRRVIAYVVIIGALFGANLLYQAHKENDFKTRCRLAGGTSAFIDEGLLNFHFSGTCLGPTGLVNVN